MPLPTYIVPATATYTDGHGGHFLFHEGDVISLEQAVLLGMPGAESPAAPAPFGDAELAYLDDRFAANQYDFVETCDVPSATGIAWPVANTAILVRVRVATPLTVDTMAYYVGSPNGAAVDLGVFRLDGATWTLLAATGSTAAVGASVVQLIALPEAVPLLPGVDYYLGLAASNATITVARVALSAALGGFHNRVVSQVATLPLTTITAPSNASVAFLPWIAAVSETPVEEGFAMRYDEGRFDEGTYG